MGGPSVGIWTQARGFAMLAFSCGSQLSHPAFPGLCFYPGTNGNGGSTRSKQGCDCHSKAQGCTALSLWARGQSQAFKDRTNGAATLVDAENAPYLSRVIQVTNIYLDVWELLTPAQVVKPRSSRK